MKRTSGQTWKERVEKQAGAGDLSLVNYYDQLFVHEPPVPTPREDELTQLKMELADARMQVNRQASINAIYASSAANQTIAGGTPSILRRDPSAVYQNEPLPSDQLLGTRSGSQSGF